MLKKSNLKTTYLVPTYNKIKLPSPINVSYCITRLLFNGVPKTNEFDS